MNATVQEWMTRLESLSADDREMLARALLDSIEPFADEDVAKAWNEEIGRRLREVQSGNAVLVDGDEFLKSIEDRP